MNDVLIFYKYLRTSIVTHVSKYEKFVKFDNSETKLKQMRYDK